LPALSQEKVYRNADRGEDDPADRPIPKRDPIGAIRPAGGDLGPDPQCRTHEAQGDPKSDRNPDHTKQDWDEVKSRESDEISGVVVHVADNGREQNNGQRKTDPYGRPHRGFGGLRGPDAGIHVCLF
jgi:hypothetical protein